MIHPDPVQRFRQVLAAAGQDAPVPATPACLDDDTLAALASGTISPGGRIAAIPHLAECARCRGVVASVARALSDPAVARELAGLGRSGRTRMARIGRILVPLAAAAVVVLLSWPGPPDDGEAPHRAPTITASPAPVPLSPIGATAVGRRLLWTAVAGADRYRVTVFERDGAVLYETELRDTTLEIPDSVEVAPGRLYLWKVEARTGVDRWTASELVEFITPVGRGL